MLSDLLVANRERNGFTVGQVAWRLGISANEYRELEAGTRWPSWDAWDRAAKLYGIPRSFHDERVERAFRPPHKASGKSLKDGLDLPMR